MNIPDEVMREGWRAYTGGVDPAELPQSWHAFTAGAEWARKQALKDAGRKAAGVAGRGGTAWQVADAVNELGAV